MYQAGGLLSPLLQVFGPLFFANATTFRDEIRRMARADLPPRWILITAEPMTEMDTTASDLLEELDEALNADGISLVFAELKDPVRRKIERYGLTRTIDPGGAARCVNIHLPERLDQVDHRYRQLEDDGDHGQEEA
jgi:MFS superfamily sulfate permease-like transporter